MSEDTTLLGRKGVGVDPREMTGEQLSNVFLDYESKLGDFEQRIINLENDFERFDPESDPLVKNPAFIVFSKKVNSLSDEMKILRSIIRD